VIANDTRLGQVFLNLLINAAQAIGDGNVERNEIRIASRTDQQGQVVVEISDTGPGIPEKVRARIFEPFFTTKPVGKGTGLGLSICHDIIAALGGTIAVESEVDRGTLVRVTLPAVASMRPRGVSLPAPPTSTRKRVLVIDDEAPVRRALRKSLRSEHDVVLVSCAQDALERILAGERYDLILCDLMMPEMTGVDLHEALLLRAPEVLPHVVFMTGGAFTDGARAFVERSTRTFLEKPIDTKRLLTMIENP
jgi:CheY-like chemotaxis protein